MRRPLLLIAVFALLFAGSRAARADDGGADGATPAPDGGAAGDAAEPSASCPAPDDAGDCPTDLLRTYDGGCAAGGHAPAGGGAVVLLLLAIGVYASFALRNSRSL